MMLEVGKTYIARDGGHVKIVGHRELFGYFLEGYPYLGDDGRSYTTGGAFSLVANTNGLVREAEASDFCEPTPEKEVHKEDVEEEVCNDIKKRQMLGIGKYRTTVASNPLPLKEWMQHDYEKALDQAIYLKRAMRDL